MPRRPLKPCAQPGCPALVESGRCPDHDRKRQYKRDHPRGSSTAQGYGQRWRRARARFLGAHPLCAQCQREGRVTAATVVDHKVPHRADAALFWDESNWQPLCGRCHDRKIAREGRWGRRSIFSGSAALGSGRAASRARYQIDPGGYPK